jgi:hypothetical protein
MLSCLCVQYLSMEEEVDLAAAAARFDRAPHRNVHDLELAQIVAATDIAGVRGAA